MNRPDAEAVLAFWFDRPLPADRPVPGEAIDRWFRADPALDAQIEARFGVLVTEALHGAHDDWCASADGWLALLIVLDQFPRNLYRGDARAFAGDPRAQAIALDGIARGSDRLLAPVRRAFAYLPLEHAEDVTLQERAVALFEALEAEAPPAQAEAFALFSDYARQHRDVIARFGRFPHRNAALGRRSSPAEQAWLDAGGGF
ncbi:DUF924 family protein [Coralloluteibacterium thermophilus]|uniref:DUF924 family protein n=1 Tax=Coralloluteibacterium thermophilum TaxID=2707049 RepID=A0ABV9NPT0_9GAMM